MTNTNILIHIWVIEGIEKWNNLPNIVIAGKWQEQNSNPARLSRESVFYY